MAAKKATKKAEPKKAEREKVAEELVAQQEDAAAGQTDAQKEMREYHEGEFQTHDPITGEERDMDAPLHVARLDRGETIEDVIKRQQAKK
jgi:hypothetical protein